MGRHGRGGRRYDEDDYQQRAYYYQQQRGGDLYSPAMGGVTGGNVTLNNNGYQPTPGVDHITVYNDTARVSWNMQDGQVAPDVKGQSEPHINPQGW